MAAIALEGEGETTRSHVLQEGKAFPLRSGAGQREDSECRGYFLWRWQYVDTQADDDPGRGAGLSGAAGGGVEV